MSGPIDPADLDSGQARTGHPRVDAALEALESAQQFPPAAQVEPLTEADRVLRETLDSIGDV